jgi:hypothetical protein
MDKIFQWLVFIAIFGIVIGLSPLVYAILQKLSGNKKTIKTLIKEAYKGW